MKTTKTKDRLIFVNPNFVEGVIILPIPDQSWLEMGGMAAKSIFQKSPSDKQYLEKGRLENELIFFDGQGKTCLTYHQREDKITITQEMLFFCIDQKMECFSMLLNWILKTEGMLNKISMQSEYVD